MTINELIVKMRLDYSQFTQGLKTADSQVAKFTSGSIARLGAVIAGAFSAGAIIHFGRRTMEYADKMRDMADALAVNVELLQKWAAAARMAGADEEKLYNTLDKIRAARQEALEKPEGPQAEAFAKLGFGREQLSTMPLQNLVAKMAENARNWTSAQIAAFEELGGKGARAMVAAMMQGLETSAPVMREKTIDARADVNDEFEILANVLRVEIAPAIITVLHAFTALHDQIKRITAFWAGLVEGVKSVHKIAEQRSEQYMQEMDKAGGVSRFVVRNFPHIMYATGYLSEVFGDKSPVWQFANHALEQQNEEINKREESLENIRKAMSDWRARREKAPPEIPQPKEKIEIPKLKEPKAPHADALIAVGNFLGAHRSIIESIGNETNNILKRIDNKLGRIVSQPTKMQFTIEVPE